MKKINENETILLSEKITELLFPRPFITTIYQWATSLLPIVILPFKWAAGYSPGHCLNLPAEPVTRSQNQGSLSPTLGPHSKIHHSLTFSGREGFFFMAPEAEVDDPVLDTEMN